MRRFPEELIVVLTLGQNAIFESSFRVGPDQRRLVADLLGLLQCAPLGPTLRAGVNLEEAGAADLVRAVGENVVEWVVVSANGAN